MSTEPQNTTSPYSTPLTDPLAPVAPGTVVDTEAALGTRIGAYVIDYIVAFAISFILSFILGMVSSSLATLAMLVALAYLLLRDSLPFLNGQSVGKKLLKIKALTLDGRALSSDIGAGLIRNAVLFIPLFPIIELIVLITRNGKPEGLRRLGDEWAKTKVVLVR